MPAAFFMPKWGEYEEDGGKNELHVREGLGRLYMGALYFWFRGSDEILTALSVGQKESPMQTDLNVRLLCSYISLRGLRKIL